MPRRRTAPTVIELFAGAGLFGAAFREEGFRLVRAIELDRVASATYRINLGEHIETGDVRRFSPDGTCDALIAGPPCQCYSTLNRARANDDRQDLCLVVAAWARACQPRVVVVENVAPFLISDSWKQMTRRLRRAGYRVSSVIVDAADYGVPQRRQRSFTFAVRDVAPVLPTALPERSTVRQAWSGLSPQPDGINHHTAPAPSLVALSRMRVIPPGGDKRDVLRCRPQLAAPSWWKVTGEVTDVWGRVEWDAPANTIRTCFQNASKGRYIHPDQHRVISLREAARIQTFPDAFQFVGVPAQIARQIGNAVPFSLGRVIARSVLLTL